MSTKQKTWSMLIIYITALLSLIVIIIFNEQTENTVMVEMRNNHIENTIKKVSHYSKHYNIKNDNPLILTNYQYYNASLQSTFINHLDSFGLTLNVSNSYNEEDKQLYIICMDLSNTTNNILNMMISYKQTAYYHLNISSNTFQYFYGYSREQMGLGIGNILSQYLAARAISYWLNYTFEWKTCDDNDYRIRARYHSKYSFSSFLPKSTIIIPEKQVLRKKRNYAYFLYANRNQYIQGDTEYIHPSSLLFVYYNRFYRDIISKEFDRALKTYYIFNKLRKKIPLRNIFTSIDSDIVIHIRCGDIWTYFGRNQQYGFLTTNYIKYSVTNGTQAIFNINWINDKLTNNTTVWIISQLTVKSMRGNDMSSRANCSYLINYLINNSFSTFFFPATVKIVYDTDINDDFYRMMNAPLLICSTSSFCLLAAIANKNGYVILPRIGPWIDLNHITNIDKNYSDIYSSDKIARHSRFLPDNHLIIDNKETRWFVKSVSDYIVDDDQSQKEKNITMLTQYLLNH